MVKRTQMQSSILTRMKNPKKIDGDLWGQIIAKNTIKIKINLLHHMNALEPQLNYLDPQKGLKVNTYPQ